MKTTLKFNLPSVELRKDNGTLTVGEGTTFEFQQEYDVSEMLEIVKAQPMLISNIKNAIKEVIESIGKYENDTAEVHHQYRNDYRYPKQPKANRPFFKHNKDRSDPKA